jgi:uncharacterized protein (DUF2141 family)
MQTLILTLIISVGTFLMGNAQNSIEVVITKFENENGKALVGLYNAEDSFLENAWQSQSAEIKKGQARVIFENIPDGTYAVSAFHDEDDDQNLDMFLGFYPTEDYATSNNAPAKFGPPKWEDAKFDLRKGEKVVQKINMM